MDLPGSPSADSPQRDPAAGGSPMELRTPGVGEILRFALPLMLGLMTTALNTLVDTIFIGRLGTAPLAAVPLAGLVYIVGWLFGVGVMRTSLAFIARAYGAGRWGEIGGMLAHYQMLAVLGLPLLQLWVLAWPVFSTLGELSAAVDDFGATYLRIRSWDVMFSLLLVLYTAFYQALGNSRFPMLINVAVVMVNIALDYGLIFGHWGLPALGVAGSALATVVSQGLGAAAILGASFAGAERPRFGLRLWVCPRRALLRDILRIGLPQGIGDAVELTAWSGFMLIVGRLGESALAASNIGVQATHLLFLPGFAFGIAASSYMGRFLGAERPDIARRTTVRVVAMGVGYMGVLGVPLWFFGETIASAFTGDPAVIRLAGLMFKVMAFYQVFDGMGVITRTALGGAGDTRWPTLALAACALAVLFPGAFLLARLVEPGLVGAWLGAFAYMVVNAICMVGRFRSGRWAHLQLHSGPA
jgi:MATE family multidrug resistance protein